MCLCGFKRTSYTNGDLKGSINAGRYTADYLSCGNLPYPAWKYAHDCAPKLQAYPPIFSLTPKASGSTRLQSCEDRVVDSLCA